MARVTPRPEQIEVLTRGIPLPFPPIRQEHLEVIAEALALAWSRLLATSRATLLSGCEAEVNTMMASELCMLRTTHRPWRQLVSSVTRGSESLNFDGRHLEKKPDLSLHLTGRHASFPLVAECKLIDARARKGHDLYCDEGLSRFLRGEYAWATREAFMLAYVRDGSTVASVLAPYILQSQSCVPPPYDVVSLPTPVMGGRLDAARSAHRRRFQYVGRLPPDDVPGDVSVWHLWLAP